jgi:hypothetical protein
MVQLRVAVRPLLALTLGLADPLITNKAPL